jgi:4'-phosphopantetheinyl transferase EntD
MTPHPLRALVRALEQPGLFWGLAHVDEPGDLFDVELPRIARAVPKRRREYSAGRLAARRALQAMGHDRVALPSDCDRVPIWPKGITGSISHSGPYAVAVVSRDQPLLGLDLEADTPLNPDLIPTICHALELPVAPDQQGETAIRIFSAKEAAYKAQFPGNRHVFGFHAMQVDLTEGMARYHDSYLGPRNQAESGQGVRLFQSIKQGWILSLCLGPITKVL